MTLDLNTILQSALTAAVEAAQAHFTPIPFDPLHDAALLSALGYEATDFAECWEDVGGPESGPKLVGERAFTAWARGDHVLIVQDGEIVEAYTDPYFDYDGADGQF